MNAKLETRTLSGLQAKMDMLNNQIINLPSDTPAAVKLRLKKEWNKAREAKRIFIYERRGSLTARGTMVRH